jgi:glucose/arabinose dehydrogenase
MSLRFVFPTSLALALVLAAGARAQELSAERVASGLAAPMTVAAPAGDPRLFIVEREGRIRVLAGGAVLPTAFLDISEDVCTTVEGGLLGLVFPPDYYENGHFFVYYTAPRGTAVPCELESRASRFTVIGDPHTSNDADEDSEQVFYHVDQPYPNHNGGTIAIRDGFLYLGLGDGGDQGDPQERAQDDGSPFGKMLRFDLADTTPPWAPQQWAKGFRNPFRFSFDRETGDLYVGDVGGGLWEEIDVEPADSPGGRNYGWDVKEGTFCHGPSAGEPACNDPSLVDPVFAYPRSGFTCVTGGSVYRGALYPALDGIYFFADYCRSKTWTLRWNPATGNAEDVVDTTGQIAADAGTIGSVAAIAEDGAGELYFVDGEDGEVFRLVPEPAAGGLGAAALAGLAALAARRRARVAR